MTDAPDLNAMREATERAARIAPGQWEDDRVEAEGGHGDYWAYAVLAGPSDKPVTLVDTINSDNALLEEERDEDGRILWDENGRQIAAFIALWNPANAKWLLSRLEQAERERGAFRAECVPISNDGKYVFIDGPGDVWLDFGDERFNRAQAAESALAVARKALEEIVEAGTHIETRRVGDAWAGDYEDCEIISPEARIAREALAKLGE